MSEDSIVAKKIIKDHMISDKLTPESVEITNKLLRSVSIARQKYGDQLAENKKTQNQQCIENHKCMLLDEIREVMAKRDELQKTCKSQGTQSCVQIESELTKLVRLLLLEEKKRKLK